MAMVESPLTDYVESQPLVGITLLRLMLSIDRWTILLDLAVVMVAMSGFVIFPCPSARLLQMSYDGRARPCPKVEIQL